MKRLEIAIPSIGKRELRAMKRPINSGWLTQGPEVTQFEREFAILHEAEFGIATTSCTTGLELALRACGIGHGDEVIAPSFTWVATINSILNVGATPRLVDIKLSNFSIDQSEILKSVTDKTKAIVIVHLFGFCYDVESLRNSLPKRVIVIEDAACAAGSSREGKYPGSSGDLAVFSFHPRKTITTGEGGMIITNNKDIANHAKILRSHGAQVSDSTRHNSSNPFQLPDFVQVGFNYRMTDLQAAVGRVQLSKLKKFVHQRKKMAFLYLDLLSKIEWVKLPDEDTILNHSWQAFVVLIGPELSVSRDDLMFHLHNNGISTRPGTHAVHRLTAHHPLSIGADLKLNNSNIAHDFSVALPMHNKLDMKDIKRVVEQMKKITSVF